MPELPEVNSFKQYFDSTALKQTIVKAHARDDYIFKDISPQTFEEKLQGRRFIGSYRRGKYFFPSLDNGHYLLIHFGMSGSFKYYSEPDDRPTYEHMAFDFGNGFTLGFNCPRKLARIRYLDNLEAFLDEKGLGPDAYNELDKGSFLQLMKGKTGTVKNFLMNQKYIAGIGNLYADEICYQAGVHPASSMDKLSQKTGGRLYDRMQEILNFAVRKNAAYSEYPDDWLWKHRREDEESPDGNGPVKKMKIAGRSTYFAPQRQRKY